MGRTKKEERDVIVRFISHLGNVNCILNLSVDRWPDEENRSEPEIDALAGCFAIEHTSIDSVAHQRQMDDWFLQVTKGLDQVIREHVSCGLTITLEYYAIGKGMDWSGIRADLRNWIVHCASVLAMGNHEIELPTSAPSEFPIVMRVWKKAAPCIVGIQRFDPEDGTLPMRIRTLLDRKASKLSRYHGLHYIP